MGCAYIQHLTVGSVSYIYSTRTRRQEWSHVVVARMDRPFPFQHETPRGALEIRVHLIRFCTWNSA